VGHLDHAYLSGAPPLSETLPWVLALAIGQPTTALVEPNWDAVLAAAARERCAYLAWMRSGVYLRAHCPSGVVDQWRALVAAQRARAERHLDTLRDTVSGLEATGTTSVVLKGLPLAQRLYAEFSARPTLDLDLFIPFDQREKADRSLREMGWSHVYGTPPAEALYRRGSARDLCYLEVHSAVLDDALLAHVSLPEPTYVWETVDGVTLRAERGALQPAALAAHLAKHHLPPLLWLIDLATVWTGLSATERHAAWKAARQHGLHRYLAWAVRLAEVVPRAAAGDPRALRRLGIGARRRHASHSAVRVAMLSASPRQSSDRRLDARRRDQRELWRDRSRARPPRAVVGAAAGNSPDTVRR
jgi:hypothetical protein